MGMFLTVLCLLVLGTAVIVGVATWASNKAATLRNVLAFCLAGGSAYSVGFVLNMWVLATTGAIPAGNVYWPSFTWLAIALACLVAAFQTAGSPLALAIPFFLNALLALVSARSARDALFITGPIVVVGVALFLYRRGLLAGGKASTRISFPIGKYRLDDSVETFTGLVEFSPAEYAAMGRQFKGENNYNAPPALHVGHSWKVKLQSVNGQICKIASYVLANKQEASPIAMRTLQYCREQLGPPAEQKTGVFVWDTTDGNVILLTRETDEGLVISLSLTSRSIRNFERL